jgi:hypothetical protein
MTVSALQSSSELKPLAGFTVGVTAARRAEELGALLERRGAEVLHAPAIKILPLTDDTELHAATEQLIDQRIAPRHLAVPRSQVPGRGPGRRPH